MPTFPSISQAFVLGAGLGTRLKTLTLRRPKPLIPVAGRPLISYGFDELLKAGVRRLVVNTHHCAAAYSRYFSGDYSSAYGAATLEFRHEPELLETGGGIKNVEDLLGGAPFLVYNGDILSTMPLGPLMQRHLESGHEVTLALRSHGGPLQIAFDAAAGRVADIGNRLGRAPGTHLFTGIYAISPAFFRRLRLEKVSVIAAFLQMLREGAPLGAVVIDQGAWWDLGTREQVLAVHHALRTASPGASWVAPGAEIHPSARITGATFVGAGAKIGANARLHDCVLWEGTRIAPQSSLTRCIVTDHQTACGDHTDMDF